MLKFCLEFGNRRILFWYFETTLKSNFFLAPDVYMHPKDCNNWTRNYVPAHKSTAVHQFFTWEGIENFGKQDVIRMKETF